MAGHLASRPAAASGAPIGDMVKQIGDALLGATALP